MKVTVSLEEILVIGSVSCALIIAIGIAFGHVSVLGGGAIIVALCGGTVRYRAKSMELNLRIIKTDLIND